MSKDRYEFISLGRLHILDAHEKGSDLRLDTQPSPETGQAYAFGCLLDEAYARRVLNDLAVAVD
ncbi:MAG: hypothetical protein OXC26_16735 [Albidovulum sp.]|nr:hypothetical protein [Albidovulum sp.]